MLCSWEIVVLKVPFCMGYRGAQVGDRVTLRPLFLPYASQCRSADVSVPRTSSWCDDKLRRNFDRRKNRKESVLIIENMYQVLLHWIQSRINIQSASKSRSPLVYIDLIATSIISIKWSFSIKTYSPCQSFGSPRLEEGKHARGHTYGPGGWQYFERPYS